MGTKPIEGLKPYLQRLRSLRRLLSIVNFDLETIAPEKGKADEADLLWFLQSEQSALLSCADFRRLLQQALSEDPKGPLGARLTLLKEEADYCEICPKQERESINKAYLASMVQWPKSFASGDWNSYLPYLKETVEACRRECSYRRKGEKTLYEVALRKSDRGLTEEALDAIFGELSSFLKRKLREVELTPTTLQYIPMPSLNEDEQRRLADKAYSFIGIKRETTGIAVSTHPFSDHISRFDSRATNRFDESDWRSSLYTAFHEGGHCLHFLLWPESYYQCYAENIASMAKCETHSRFFENFIGRDKRVVPHIRKWIEEIKGESLPCSSSDLYAYINRVAPSLIRTEADELTYSLHIVIRYQIEKELINGTLPVEKARDRWNDLYASYLGIRPNNDKEGILQDIHWADGSFGYFPSYALGNIYGAMIFEALGKEVDVDKALRKGDCQPILDWLAKFDIPYDYLDAEDWIRQITGKGISAKPFIDYLDRKYPLEKLEETLQD